METKFDFSGTKSLMVDLMKPHKRILPLSNPADYANVATCALEYRRHMDSTPNITVKNNQIFQTRMAHPLGTMIGERLQKTISMQ